MPDHRLFDLGQRVQDAIDPPDFEELRGRGRRLVRTRVIAVAFAAAVIAATGVTVATSGLVDSDAPVADVPREDLTPEQAVHHPQAQLESFAVDAQDPDVRAAVWKVPCGPTKPGQECKFGQNVLTVTDDGFSTASYVGLADERRLVRHSFHVQAVGGDRFYVSGTFANRIGPLVDVDGNIVPVTVTETPAPVGADEVLLESLLLADPRTGPYHQMALDVDAARAHPVGDGYAEQNPDGTLWYFSYTRDDRVRVRLSTDGGATWSSQPAPLKGDGVYVSAVRSAASGTMALVEAAEELYVELHLSGLARSTDNGRTWENIDGPSIRAYWVVVRPDGSLLMQGKDGRVYSSAGTDWTKATPVEPGLPAVEWTSLYVSYEHVESTVADDGTHTMYVFGNTEQRVYMSTDGSHWEETPAR